MNPSDRHSGSEQVDDVDEESSSSILSFVAPPAVDPDHSFHFLVYADMGISSDDAASAGN